MSALRLRVRGFSLALVLLVSSIAITVGFAIAALSSVSLNLAAQTLNQARASALARGVVAELCYELDQRVWKKNPWGVSGFPDMAYGSDAIRERFRTLPLFPDPDQHVMEGALRAYVSFDGSDYFSVDNLNFAEPCPGYTDKGTARASVAPFSVSLVVNTGLGETLDTATDKRHFESVICRAWPYAVYALKPSLQLSNGTVVRGSVYDRVSDVRMGESGKPPVAVQGDVCVMKERGVAKVVAAGSSTVSGRVRYGVRPPVGRTFGTDTSADAEPVGIGSFQVPVPESAQRASGGAAPAHLDPFNPNPLEGMQGFRPTPVVLKCPISVLELWLYLGSLSEYVVLIPFIREMLLSATDTALKRVTIWHGNPPQPLDDLNQYRGAVSFRFILAAATAATGFGAYGENGALLTVVLAESVRLNEGVYILLGSITNHLAVDRPGSTESEDLWTGDASGPSTVELTDAVLIVLGDLDIRGLKGDNSTLYVTGNLFLRGGSLDSGNKGMLVLANNVIIDASGDFRGVIAARGSMRLKPLPGTGRLTVRGAVMAEGNGGMAAVQDSTGVIRVDPAAPLIIDNTTVFNDRRYTKALNRVGTCRRLVFREVP